MRERPDIHVANRMNKAKNDSEGEICAIAKLKDVGSLVGNLRPNSDP